MEENRTGRARPMSRDERRSAIALATIPLLEEHGSQVSTRQIALAAGVAEGTLFRAFDDKVELLHSAAERAVDPTSAVAEIDDLPDAGSLRDELRQVVEVVAARGRRIRRVMLAVHGIMASDAARPRPLHPGPMHPGGGRDARFRALTELRGAVERRIEPYRDELRIEPERLAQVLLAAIMGQGPPALPEDAEVPVADLVDVLLHGAART